jgi:glycosyltransferase involved in cell wall biosynthesis
VKILFVVSGLGVGGAERQVVLLSREYARCGHQVGIHTLNDLLKRADELAGSGVEIIADQKRSRLDPAVVLRLRKRLKHWQPDVVHSFLYDADIYARLAALGLGIPVLGSERSNNYKVPPMRRLGYALTRWMSVGIVANSHAGAAFAAAVHRQPFDHVHVVYNGIDLAEIDRRLAVRHDVARQIWPADGVKRACIVGSIRPPKDYPLALRTMRAAVDSDPSWRFICVGEAQFDDPTDHTAHDYKRYVMQEIERLSLHDHVAFVGRRQDVPEIMASCDALLVTSQREGFPNVVLEAMACGTPVASTDYSDVRQILPRPWQVVGSRDAAELAAALARCVVERDAVVAAQRRWVEQHATIAASAQSMLDVYRRFTKPQPSLSAA